MKTPQTGEEPSLRDGFSTSHDSASETERAIIDNVIRLVQLENRLREIRNAQETQPLSFLPNVIREIEQERLTEQVASLHSENERLWSILDKSGPRKLSRPEISPPKPKRTVVHGATLQQQSLQHQLTSIEHQLADLTDQKAKILQLIEASETMIADPSQNEELTAIEIKEGRLQSEADSLRTELYYEEEMLSKPPSEPMPGEIHLLEIATIRHQQSQESVRQFDENIAPSRDGTFANTHDTLESEQRDTINETQSPEFVSHDESNPAMESCERKEYGELQGLREEGDFDKDEIEV